MPTMAEYASSGGYARDAQAAKTYASTPAPSYSSGSSSKKKTPTPQSGGYMNVPTAGGSNVSAPPMPASYQVGDVTYTPGPANWGNMSQSQRDAYGSSLAGRNMPPVNNTDNGMLFPAKPNGRGPGGVVGAEGGWADGVFYAPLQTPPSSQQVKMSVPGQWPATPATATPAFPVKTAAEIAAEAKARTDALLAKQTTLAGQTKAGFQTAYDRLSSTTKDDRTLADAAFQRNTNPFSGSTGLQKDMTGRQREISDQQSKQDLQTRLANVDLSLADYTNATEAQRMQMETDMTNAERAYGLQVDQLALQRRGQEQSQFNADRQFNYGVGRDAVGDSRYADTTTYNRGRDTTLDNRYSDTTSYNRGQDQITNNRNAANDALALRKQHIDEANYISDKYNIHIDPKDDYQLMLDQAAGLPTAAEKTAAQRTEDTRKSEAWKRLETLGSVQSQADADLLNIPVGTQTQKAKQDAMDNAIKNRNADAANARANRPTAEKPPAQTKPMTAGAYKTNPDFADEIATIQANPGNALSQVQAHAQALIQAYGYEGYQELVQAATPKK